MMKALLIALGALSIGLGTAVAQSGSENRFLDRASVSDVRATDLLDATVYVTDVAVATLTVDGVPDDWESVGAVADLVVSQDGDVRGVLLDVGGFLGLFSRSVRVEMQHLEIQTDPQNEAVRVYLDMSREELEALPEHEQ